MAEGFKELIFAFAIAGLFLIAMVSFASQFNIENSTNTSLLDDPRINQSNLNIEKDLSSLRNTSNSQQNATEKEDPATGSDNLILVSVWGSVKKMSSVTRGSLNSILSLLAERVSPIVLGTISALLVLSLLLFGWRLIRSGE